MKIHEDVYELLCLFEEPNPREAFKPRLQPADWKEREARQLHFRSQVPDHLELAYDVAIADGLLELDLLEPNAQLEAYRNHGLPIPPPDPRHRGTIFPSNVDGYVEITDAGRAAIAACRLDGERANKQPAKGKRGPKPNPKGRRPKEESDNAARVVAALTRWHKYQSDGSVGNTEPATNKDIAEQFSRPPLANNALSRFLNSKLGKGEPKKGGHNRYVAACAGGKIGTYLALWNRELPSRLAELSSNDAAPDN